MNTRVYTSILISDQYNTIGRSMADNVRSPQTIPIVFLNNNLTIRLPLESWGTFIHCLYTWILQICAACRLR